MEAAMTRLQLAFSLIAAVAIAGLLIWKAEATPLTGALATHAVPGGYSAVQKAGCMFGTHRCAAGTKWSCIKTPGVAGPNKKCVCRPC
jgi:hypothetical protein